MFVYESKDWPHFYWDKNQVDGLLQTVIYNQGKLAAITQSLGFKELQDSRLDVMTEDVLQTSLIEGEKLEENDVRSSIARTLGLPFHMYKSVSRHADGIVQIAIDSTLNAMEVLNTERLCDWHRLLFPMGYSGFSKIDVGSYRTDIHGKMQVVSGHLGKEKVHFIAPSADCIVDEMQNFLKWYNEETAESYFLKAAVAHLWFVTIHPFDDGNGRIVRALTDMLLARSEENKQRFYSMSSAIFDQRRGYYDALEAAQKGTVDITPWILWFLSCANTALLKSYGVVVKSLRKETFWKAIRETALNARQIKIVNMLFDGFEGKLTTTKYAKINHCSQDTAQRDLIMLMEHGLVQKNGELGRNVHYSMNDVFLK